MIGITTVLLNTGEVLFWSYDPAEWANPAASNTGKAYVWNPATRSGVQVTPPENIWCGGQTILADGRVFVAGGNLRYPDPNAPSGTGGWEGALSSYIFHPSSRTWIRQPDMARGRWYPTVTKLPNNQVVITSGYDESGSQAIVQEVELFTPSASPTGSGTITPIGTHNPTDLYPFQFVLSDGKMLQAGPDQSNSALLTPGTWSWSNAGSLRSGHVGIGNGIIYTDASVTPLKQTVMLAGGESGSNSIAANEVLDGTNAIAAWQPFPNWLQPRHNSNTVILPDGTLFTVGGNTGTGTYANPLYHAELYNKPATDPNGSWVAMQPNSLPAAYHSTAILLPDATVLLSKDDRSHTAEGHQIEIFSPPYLSKGNRPRITSLPASATWGQTIPIGNNASNISSVALVAPGAVTHGNDMHQRVVKLATRGGAKNLEATIPSSSVVPPGDYMLFIFDGKGVPSTARFVRIG